MCPLIIQLNRRSELWMEKTHTNMSTPMIIIMNMGIRIRMMMVKCTNTPMNNVEAMSMNILSIQRRSTVMIIVVMTKKNTITITLDSLKMVVAETE